MQLSTQHRDAILDLAEKLRAQKGVGTDPTIQTLLDSYNAAAANKLTTNAALLQAQQADGMATTALLQALQSGNQMSIDAASAMKLTTNANLLTAEQNDSMASQQFIQAQQALLNALAGVAP